VGRRDAQARLDHAARHARGVDPHTHGLEAIVPRRHRRAGLAVPRPPGVHSVPAVNLHFAAFCVQLATAVRWTWALLLP
jgi:hypothetical protein